tara:strand:- start:1357 stop:1776 length:420 start_codon:yes stop_codon:yes gene_type:complete
MAMYVGGVQVTGTQTLDATKLTGNLPALNGASLTSLTPANLASGTLPALNGSNLTSLPSPSTIPTLGSNSVSSFGFLKVDSTTNNNSTIVPGNYGNNANHYRGHWSDSTQQSPTSPASGTWRCFGNSVAGAATLFQRIS